MWHSADISWSHGQCDERVMFKIFYFMAVFSRMQQKLSSTAALWCSSETAPVAFESLHSFGVGSSAQNMFLLFSWWWHSCCTARTFMMSVDSSASTKHFLNLVVKWFFYSGVLEGVVFSSPVCECCGGAQYFTLIHTWSPAVGLITFHCFKSRNMSSSFFCLRLKIKKRKPTRLWVSL